MGAQNVSEALAFIPGMTPGIDVFGVQSLMVRGLWAHEGKVLLLLDDLPLNESLYGSLNLNQHYPVAQIERIEVLRGAGSARYGGNAQIAVIRIYTKTAATSDAFAEGRIDYQEGAGWGRQATVFTSAVRHGAALSLSGHWSAAPATGATWEDNTGQRWALGDMTEVRTCNGIGKFDWRGWKARTFFDRQSIQSPQKFGAGQRGEKVWYTNVNGSLSYDAVLQPGWILTPRVGYRLQHDWFIDRDPAQTKVVDFFLPVRQVQGGVELKAQQGAVDWLAGVETWQERAWVKSPGGPPGERRSETYFQGQDHAVQHGRSGYAQADWARGPWLVSAGARYSWHATAGESLVPRLALGWFGSAWHVKAVAGQAYREPDVEVINASDRHGAPVRPETTTQREVEVGCELARGWFASVALFDLRIADPIVYTSTTTGYDYSNVGRLGTRGSELEVRGRGTLGTLYLGYSNYRAVGLAPIEYRVQHHRQSYLGAPQHKAWLAADLHRPRQPWHWQAAVQWYDNFEAYGYMAGASDFQGNALALRHYDAQCVVHLAVRYERGTWTTGVGVANLTDAARPIPQPYRSESPPYPGARRTWWWSINRTW